MISKEDYQATSNFNYLTIAFKAMQEVSILEKSEIMEMINNLRFSESEKIQLIDEDF